MKGLRDKLKQYVGTAVLAGAALLSSGKADADSTPLTVPNGCFRVSLELGTQQNQNYAEVINWEDAYEGYNEDTGDLLQANLTEGNFNTASKVIGIQDYFLGNDVTSKNDTYSNFVITSLGALSAFNNSETAQATWKIEIPYDYLNYTPIGSNNYNTLNVKIMDGEEILAESKKSLANLVGNSWSFDGGNINNSQIQSYSLENGVNVSNYHLETEFSHEVPEPTTIALLTLGFASGLYGRTKREEN